MLTDPIRLFPERFNDDRLSPSLSALSDAAAAPGAGVGLDGSITTYRIGTLGSQSSWRAEIHSATDSWNSLAAKACNLTCDIANVTVGKGASRRNRSKRGVSLDWPASLDSTNNNMPVFTAGNALRANCYVVLDIPTAPSALSIGDRALLVDLLKRCLGELMFGPSSGVIDLGYV